MFTVLILEDDTEQARKQSNGRSAAVEDQVVYERLEA